MIESIKDYTIDNNGWTTQDSRPRLIADYNGDGYDDIIAFSSSGVFVSYGDPLNMFSVKEKVSDDFGILSSPFGYTSYNQYPRFVADINNDTMADIIGCENDGIYVSLSQGNGTYAQAKTLYSSKFGVNDGYTTYNDFPRVVFDVDGDGFADIVGFSNTGVEVQYSNGTHFVSRIGSDMPNQFSIGQGYSNQDPHPRYVADYNGDGYGDIIGIQESQIVVSLSNNGLGFGPINTIVNNDLCPNATWTNTTLYPRFVLDLNKDGQADIIGFACCGLHSRISRSLPGLSARYQIISPDYTRVDNFEYSTNEPRFMGDFDGDGIQDIIGFKQESVYYSLGSINCTHSTRDVDNRCACRPGKWDNQDDDLCPDCLAKCNTCTNGTQCETCAIGSFRVGVDCVCPQRYWDDLVNITCRDCSSNCLDCTDSSTCTNCDTNYIINAINGCSLCSSLPNRNSDCSCQDGYFHIIDSGPKCKQCDNTQCATCDIAQNNCTLVCDPSCQRCDISGKCISCNTGYYMNPYTQLCEQCDEKCEVCDQSNRNICLVCNKNILGRQFDPSTNCDCLEGYYEVPGQLNCVEKTCKISNCKICDSNGDCLECMNDDMLPPFCKIKKDSKLYYSDVLCNGSQCSKTSVCSPLCETCQQSYDNCVSCAQGYNRNQQVPCNCLDGYHDNNRESQDCEKCPIGCKECNNNYNCLKCEDWKNLSLNKYTLKCECDQGYKFSQDQEKCIRCFQYNGQCILQCPKETQPNDISFICQHKDFLNMQLSSLIYICFALILFFISVSYYLGSFYIKHWRLQKKQNNKNISDKNISDKNTNVLKQQNEQKHYIKQQ